MSSPRIITPHQQQGEFGGIATSPASSSSGRKRGHSPTGEKRCSSPKYMKQEQISRDISDVRSSPHHPRSHGGGSTVGMATPPMIQSQEFPMQMSAPMIPSHTPQLYSHIQSAPAGYVPGSHTQQQPSRLPTSAQVPSQHESSNSGPHYSNPVYTGSACSRQLPMAPPLSIPPSGATSQAHKAGGQSSQDMQRTMHPLLPAGNPNSSISRILLPGEGTGMTPTDSPSNFASNLYPSSGLAGIGTNVSIPRISTDVGSLFYNWNTNEPGLSPATSMMLNQFRDAQDGSGPAQPDQVGGPNRSQMSAPPISAGVLENFSPTTAQWLSGHHLPSTQADASRPY